MYNDISEPVAKRDIWLHGIRLQIRVIGALVLRETRSHFGEMRLGYLWAIIEPCLHLFMYTLLFRYILICRSPVGGSLPVFFLTGFIPYFLYQKIASYLTTAVQGNRSLLNLPPIKPLDVLVARAILELITYLLAGAILLTAVFLKGDRQAIPYDPVTVEEAIAVAVCFGFGIGMINVVLNAYIRSWPFLFTVFFGPLYFLSGIFFVVEEVPLPYRDYLLYIPTLQIVVWFRRGFYHNYSPTYFYPGYILAWTVSVMVIGLALMRIMRRKLLEPV